MKTKLSSLISVALITSCVSLSAAYYGLFIGIDYYSYASSLPSCVNDADGMLNRLLTDSTRWSLPQTIRLTNTGATKAAARAQIASLAAAAVSGDVVLIYQSSHGDQISGTNACLCMYDDLYQDTEFAADIAAFANGVTLIVMLDACHSGGMFKSDGSDVQEWNFAANVMTALTEIKAKSGGVEKAPTIGWMTACDYDETCWAGATYSLFTGYALEGLRFGDSNSDENISFYEMFAYARTLALADNPEQTAQYLNYSTLNTTIATAASYVDDYEPDDSYATASTIEIGDSQMRSIYPVGDQDYVSFYLTSAESVIIETSGASGNTFLSLYDFSLNLISSNDNDGTGNFSKVMVEGLPAGIYYIVVEENGNDATIPGYRLSLDTAGDIYEPDNSFATASVIARNETQNRSIHIIGDEDYVMFTLTSSSSVTIETDGPTGDTYMYLYNSTHGTITSDDDSGNGFFSLINRTLSAGTYFIRVRPYSVDGTIAAYTLSLNVILPGSPVIGLSEATLSVECAVGTTAASQTFEIRNTGGGTLSYSISDNTSWMTCTPTTGSSIGDSDVITINFTTSSLSIGSFGGTITISGNALNTGITLHVNLLVVEPVPEIAFTPATLQPFCGRTTDPEPLTFELWNSGYGTLQYGISANQPWLSVHPLFGTSSGEHDMITVSFSTSGLDYGSYSATLTLSDTEATNSPQYITVLLTVQRPEIAVAPSSLSSVCWIDTDAASQTFTVQNVGDDTLNYDISADATWLTLSPTGGVSTGEADVINVVYNTSQLPYGTHTANVTIRDDEASNSPFSFTVTVLVNTPYAPPPVRTAFVNGGIYAATECMATASPLRRGTRVFALALIIAVAVAFRRARALTAVVMCFALTIPGTAEASSAGGPRLDSDVILPEKSFFYTEQSSFRAIVPSRGVTNFPIRFYNIGSNVLKWSIDSLPEWLTADQMSGDLEADQNETLIVSVDVKRLPKKINESGVREATGLIEFSFSRSYYRKAAIQVLATTSTVEPKPDPDAGEAQPLKSYSLMNRVLVEDPADVKLMPDSQATNINMLRSDNNSDPNYYANYSTGYMERYRTYGVGVSMDDLFTGKSTDYEPTLGLLLSYRRKPPLTNLGLLAEFAFASTSDESGDEDVLILTFGGGVLYFLPYLRGSYIFSGLRYGIENRTHKDYDDLDETTGALAIPVGLGYTFYGTMFDCRASFSMLPFTDNIGGLMSFSLLYYY